MVSVPIIRGLNLHYVTGNPYQNPPDLLSLCETNVGKLINIKISLECFKVFYLCMRTLKYKCFLLKASEVYVWLS